jgi:hypothetical protein
VRAVGGEEAAPPSARQHILNRPLYSNFIQYICQGSDFPELLPGPGRGRYVGVGLVCR